MSNEQASKAEQYAVTDNVVDMNQNYMDWTTDDIIKWIETLNSDFAKKYAAKFTKQKITGKNFKTAELGNVKWCEKNLFDKNAKLAKKFADIVCQRIKNYENSLKSVIMPTKHTTRYSESDHDSTEDSASIPFNNKETQYQRQRRASCASMCASDSDESDCIGFSVGGGAKDINNFIQNVKQKRMPPITSITYQGTFYQYLFDTKTNKRKCIDVENENDDEKKQNNQTKADSPLFYPTYCYAKAFVPAIFSKDIDSSEYEYYMTIGLNSTIKQSDFKRKKLNLLIILDKSGSMQSSFSGAYNNSNCENSKMIVAEKSVISLLKHLTNEDRFGLISFDNDAYIHQEIDFMSNIKIELLKQKIMEIKADNGTNFEIGFKKALELYSKLFKIINDISAGSYSSEYENRIIMLTDACPNSGMTDSNSLLNMVQKCAEQVQYTQNRIYTTFIGVGLDFNTSLVEEISTVRGSNYYSVHSNAEFEEKMDEEFEYMVTPLVFNLSLRLKSEGNSCTIDNVYGCNENKLESMIGDGQIQQIKTLFPSKKNKGSGGTKGGIILIKLKLPKKQGKNDAANVEMLVSYEDRDGNIFKNDQFITLDEKNNKNKVDNKNNEGDEQKVYDSKAEMFGDKLSYYDNSGIHKGIVLTRYVSLVKEWIEEDSVNNPNGSSLYVSEKYKKSFEELKKYIKYKSEILNDPGWTQELEILDILTDSN